MAQSTADVAAAVVVGLDSITGLQTARVLAGRGVPVVGIAANANHAGCRTRACRRVVVANTAGQPLVDTLWRLAPTFSIPPVLFPCTDLSVQAISHGRERLGARYHVVLPAESVIELLLDKARFCLHAAQAGWPLAPARVLRRRADAEAAARELRFPCVLKPAVKTPAWSRQTTAKLYKALNAADLVRLYERCCDWTDTLVAQEWVDGPDTSHFTCNAYFDRDSRPLLTFASQKIRQWPPEGGVGCLSQECRNDEVVELTVAVFGSVRHYGLGYLETKLDPRTGDFVILESNVGRPTGRSAAADRAGVELLYTQYCDALGLPLPATRARREERAKWIYFRQDFQSALRQLHDGTLTPSGWVRSLRGCRHDAVFSLRDPWPFVADMAHAFGKTLPDRWRRTRELAVPPSRATAGLLHAPARPAVAGVSDVVDFDVHGMVGVRLLAPSPSDVAAVERQLGALQSPLTGTPDIVVRFVNRLPIDDLRWVEHGRTGFNDEGFFVLQSSKRAARVKVAFEQVGRGCEIVCERGLRSVPFLLAVINHTVLQRDGVPLHASAFVHEGTGVLVTGWAKGGKTEALLAFAERGAEYVGDEWIVLSGDGHRMFGIPEVIRLQEWHLAQLPRIRREVAVQRRLVFGAIRALDRAHGVLPQAIAQRFPATLVQEALPALRRQLNVQLDPHVVFGSGMPLSACPEKVFFMVSHDRQEYSVDPVDPIDVAERMTASIGYEMLPLFASYLAYQFAFPGRRSTLLDNAAAARSAILARALAGKDAYVVRHPYPCNLQQLFEVMAPYCSASSRAFQSQALAKGAVNVEATHA